MQPTKYDGEMFFLSTCGEKEKVKLRMELVYRQQANYLEFLRKYRFYLPGSGLLHHSRCEAMHMGSVRSTQETTYKNGRMSSKILDIPCAAWETDKIVTVKKTWRHAILPIHCCFSHAVWHQCLTAQHKQKEWTKRKEQFPHRKLESLPTS